ncbi:hypothetical protein EC988_001884, partial [Linderina pennispora]
LGSDLEDSDDDSKNLILKRVVARPKLGAGRQTTLSDMFSSRKATVAPPESSRVTTTPKKRVLKRSKVIDSDDDEDSEVFKNGSDESDDEPVSPIKPRARAPRGRATANKPVYVNISEDDDDNDDASDNFDDDDDDDFEMD